MAPWLKDELDKIGRTDQLQLAPLGRDGTRRKPVTVWVVRLGDDLYVRSWRGRAAAWFRGAQDRREGHISGGGVDQDVLFADADPTLNDEIDAAYRTKYRRSGAGYVNAMVASEARAATIRLVPRGNVIPNST